MKKIVCILLILASVFGLTACHGTTRQAAFQVPDSFDTNTQYEITFWAKNDTNKNQVNVYRKAIADFQSVYPNITVNMKLYTNYNTIYNDVITNIATSTTPNVCISYPDHIATYLTGENTVVPLDDLMDDPQYGLGGAQIAFDGPTKEEIVPQFLSECIVSGNYYAMPYMRSTEACYINKDFVEKLGYELPQVLTWDFVWEVSEAAMEKNADGTYKVNGQTVMLPFIYKSSDNMMIQMLNQLDADYSNRKGDILIFNDTTKELLLEMAAHAKTGAFNTFKTSTYPANYLNAGQCIFAIDSTAGATWMGSDAPLMDIPEDKRVSFETVVKPIPQFDTENPKMISQGPSVCIFNKEDPQQVLASWLFVQFLLTDEVQIGYSHTEGYVPVTTKAQQSAEYLDYMSRKGQDNDLYYTPKIEASQLLLDNLDNTFVTPVFNGSASLRDAAGQMIDDTVRSIKQKKTVDAEFVDTLFDNMTALYRLDSIVVGQDTGKGQLAPMPIGSKALIVGLIFTWLCIGVYSLCEYRKKKKTNKY